MQNIPDNELDKIFKEAAGKFNAEFDPKAWEAMEKKLDDLPPRGGGLFYYRFLSGVVLLLLLLGGFIGWYANQAPSTDAQHTKKSDYAGRVSDLREPLEGGLIARGNADQSPESAALEENDIPMAVDRDLLESSVATFGLNDLDERREPGPKDIVTVVDEQAPTVAHKLFGDKEPNPSKTLIVIPVDKKQSLRTSPLNHWQGVVAKEKESKDVAKQKGFGYWVWSPQLKGGEMHAVDLEELVALQAADSEAIMEKDQDDGQQPVQFSRWAVKLMVAPDFSSIGYFQPDRSGYNFGASIEYFISSRWSLTVGALYSTKIYFSDEPIEGYSVPRYNATIDRLDADCKVLDIPINVTYYLHRGKTNNFYLSGGFSSYFMLSEFYEYQGEWNGMEWAEEELFENKNNHIFGLFNFSLGYERRLTPKLFLQVEPFLKSPIQGIGEGKVDLISSGMFLNLKYRFSKEVNP